VTELKMCMFKLREDFDFDIGVCPELPPFLMRYAYMLGNSICT